ncbi:DUF588 domain-containing protein [Cephalotus follicularis]|uniref:CASP-like protein n=1 Tax=Cephalotus follicularis TaxID=3775 RepID=A0A1Q3B4L0_CEPFO|nr:DUF588 domain-containing protein [Cephalotus follicularis]
MARIEDKLPQNLTLKTQKLFIGSQICLRIATIATTMAAMWLALTSKQSVALFGFVLEARYNYSPAFQFFAFANAIACVFSLLSLFFVVMIARQAFIPNKCFILFLHDLVMMSLVLAGCAAATAIGYVGKYGNSHSGWMPVCDHFGKFCKRMTASLILSYLAFFALLVLTITSAIKSRHIQV